MFRFNPQHSHIWEDMALNIGKLSLAGLFVTGTVFWCNAYAEIPSTATTLPVSQPALHPGG